MPKCDTCKTNKINCQDCRDNPAYAEIRKKAEELLASIPRLSMFQPYVPVCPRGYMNCVRDPAYILYHYPDWYKELYGDKTPLEAIWVKNGCWDSFTNDPNEEYYCYDDEDK